MRPASSPPLRCPRDHGRLARDRVRSARGPLEIDRCRECRGIWLDAGEPGMLLDSSVLEFLIVEGTSRRSPLGCPRCGFSMALTFVGGVAVDSCIEGCGLWLDETELDALAAHVQRERRLDPRSLRTEPTFARG